MPDLSELETLIRQWLDYADANPAADQFGRHAGFVSGLRICAQQVETALERIRSDA